MEEQNINQEDVQEEAAEIVGGSTDIEAKQEDSSSELSESSSTEQNSNEEVKLESPSQEASSDTETVKNEAVQNSEEENSVKESAEQTASAEEEDEEELGAGGLKKLPEAKENFPWFVVHTYSGSEAKVKIALLDRIRNAKAEDKFGHIVVPEENVTEMVKGEKKTSKKKFFPGYIMVQCQLDEHAWHLVTGTPKVTGFVGDNVNPSPLSPEEVGALLQQIEGKGPKSRASVEFEQGDTVKVVDGPFSDFNGTVDDVKPDKGKLRVLISIFGRNTPVELDFFQVEKV